MIEINAYISSALMILAFLNLFQTAKSSPNKLYNRFSLFKELVIYYL